MSRHDPAPRDPPGDRRPIVVLLVDDQPFVGIAITRLLAGEVDIEVHNCHAAVEAVAQARRIRPTLILQDLVMPDIDGITLVESFRRDSLTAHTPVIVLSGNDDHDSRVRATAAGANAFLVKLPARRELVDCIRRHAMAPTRSSAGPVAIATGDAEDDCTLDPSVIADLRDASSDFAMDLVELFIHDAEARLTALLIAAELDDATELRTSAHCLKGSAMTMGARKLATLCARLETQATAAGDRQTALMLIAAIGDELGEVSHALMQDPRNRQARAPEAGDAQA